MALWARFEDEWLALSFLSSAAPPNSLVRLRPLALVLPAAPVCENKLQVALFARRRSKNEKNSTDHLVHPEARPAISARNCVLT